MSRELAQFVKDGFRRIYNIEPRLFRAPGRVNLIGEHTDYNDGFVLPIAIDRETVVAFTERDDRKINVTALDVSETCTIDLDESPVYRTGSWRDYVEGIVRILVDGDVGVRGADIVFASTVPIGGGLSSSAALEIAVGKAIVAVNGLAIDPASLARAAQKAEHEFVGTRSGIMDQFTSVFGREGHALLIDCRDSHIEYVPLRLADAALVVCDTGVRHELATSEYNTRRSECEEAVSILRQRDPQIESLRDITPELLDNKVHILPLNLRKRVKHVVKENERTRLAATALADGDLTQFGNLMYSSHDSLRDLYEVSCEELNVLVEAASKISGVYGSRMTGGGFGGCTVSLVSGGALDEFESNAADDYRKSFGRKPTIFTVAASDGASEILSEAPDS